VTNLATPDWRDRVERLSEVSGVDVVDYDSFVRALEERRAFLKDMGAMATDHSALSPLVERLPLGEAEASFARALRGVVGKGDAARFTAHMLAEMARMSAEVTGIVDEEDAREMAYELAYGLAKRAYRLATGPVRSVR
jgi:glucuronate isomerase